MAAVRFTQDVTTKEAKPQTFKKGDVVDFYELYADDEPPGVDADEFDRSRRARAEASARHWVSRGFAEEVEEEQPKTRKGVKSAPEEKTGEKAAYDEMTVEELHKLATDRDIEGRSGLDKAGLVKALDKADRTPKAGAPAGTPDESAATAPAAKPADVRAPARAPVPPKPTPRG